MLTANACAVLLATGSPVIAQENTMMNMQMIAGCQPTQQMESLAEQFDEIPFVGGPGVFRRWDGEFADGVLKIYANPATLTFTVVVEFPSDGISCIVLMGDDLQPIVQGQAL
jgi:hypothetical protein